MNLHILPLPGLTRAVAAYVFQLSAEAIATGGRFTVAISGGSLPKLVFPHLIVEPLRTQIDWRAWHVFWVDERCVPLTDPESNYRIARKYLFNHVDIPPAQIYALNTSLGSTEAAVDYQTTLHQVFQPALGQLPVFDLILLGMGEDGHTASLFPHHPLLKETERWVTPIFDSPKPPPVRITLTLPVINNARKIVFLVIGAGKASVLQRVLETKAPPGVLPAQMVQPTHGKLHWFIDEAAAAKVDV